jgi:hypothetical protein
MIARTLTLLSILCLSAARAGELPLAERLGLRSYPSVFQAWSEATALPGYSEEDMMAMHDVIFLHPARMGLELDGKWEGLAAHFDKGDIAEARKKRARLLAKNPRLVLLAEVHYHDASPKEFLPDNSPYWQRDAKGKRIPGWEEGGWWMLDYEHEPWQKQVALRAKAVMDTGVFDGIMLDWWEDDEAHLALVQKVRAAIGGQALIMTNSNAFQIPRCAPYVNGMFMECDRTADAKQWKDVSDTLLWAEANLRQPHVNCVETWYHKSRKDYNLMRSVTTLALTHSDGCCLFSDPNDLPTDDHLHDWYDFWNKGLGRPVHEGYLRNDGAWQRPFTGGTAIYNPEGNKPVTVAFDKPHRSRATGKTGLEFVVPALDGDIFIAVEGKTEVKGGRGKK